MIENQLERRSFPRTREGDYHDWRDSKLCRGLWSVLSDKLGGSSDALPRIDQLVFSQILLGLDLELCRKIAFPLEAWPFHIDMYRLPGCRIEALARAHVLDSG